jgi:heme-degrading monooxygenase HmoA
MAVAVSETTQTATVRVARPKPVNVRVRAVILEHAVLPVKPGEESDFEAAFALAKPIIASMPGFRSLILSRCIERPSVYLLLVEWDRLEDHTERFRGSPDYQEWRGLLHHFYDPFPTVEHFESLHLA